MKNKSIHTGRIIWMLLVGFSLYSCGAAQKAGEPVNTVVTAAIDSNNWVFTALQVRPQVGRSGPVNGLYTVSFTPGKLNVYLPYFGRAFSNADLLSNKSPLDFVLTDFTVDKQEVKAGRWRIVFKPVDPKEVQSLSFLMFSNGSASLDVILTNRSPISFSGTVAAGKNK